MDTIKLALWMIFAVAIWVFIFRGIGKLGELLGIHKLVEYVVNKIRGLFYRALHQTRCIVCADMVHLFVCKYMENYVK